MEKTFGRFKFPLFFNLITAEFFEITQFFLQNVSGIEQPEHSLCPAGDFLTFWLH
jgi:hypothetical protein